MSLHDQINSIKNDNDRQELLELHHVMRFRDLTKKEVKRFAQLAAKHDLKV